MCLLALVFLIAFESTDCWTLTESLFLVHNWIGAPVRTVCLRIHDVYIFFGKKTKQKRCLSAATASFQNAPQKSPRHPKSNKTSFPLSQRTVCNWIYSKKSQRSISSFPSNYFIFLNLKTKQNKKKLIDCFSKFNVAIGWGARDGSRNRRRRCHQPEHSPAGRAAANP